MPKTYKIELNPVVVDLYEYRWECDGLCREYPDAAEAVAAYRAGNALTAEQWGHIEGEIEGARESEQWLANSGDGTADERNQHRKNARRCTTELQRIREALKS